MDIPETLVAFETQNIGQRKTEHQQQKRKEKQRYI
jgi:hypothetical protein